MPRRSPAPPRRRPASRNVRWIDPRRRAERREDADVARLLREEDDERRDDGPRRHRDDQRQDDEEERLLDRRAPRRGRGSSPSSRGPCAEEPRSVARGRHGPVRLGRRRELQLPDARSARPAARAARTRRARGPPSCRPPRRSRSRRRPRPSAASAAAARGPPRGERRRSRGRRAEPVGDAEPLREPRSEEDRGPPVRPRSPEAPDEVRARARGAASSELRPEGRAP